VPGIDEANEVRRLVVEQGIGAHGIGRAMPGLREAWSDVSLLLGRAVGVAAMAINAAKTQRLLLVGIVCVLVAGDATGTLGCRLFDALTEETGFRRILARQRLLSVHQWPAARHGCEEEGDDQ